MLEAAPVKASEECLSRRQVVVFGFERVGKSSLLAALSGASEFSGSTLDCQSFLEDSTEWVDTPGFITDSDARTVADAVAVVNASDTVLLVLRADRAVEELEQLVPLLKNQRVTIVLTHRDRLLAPGANGQRLAGIWSRRLGVPVMLLDCRQFEALELASLRVGIAAAKPLSSDAVKSLPRFVVLPQGQVRRVMERLIGWPPLSFVLLFGPAWIAVTLANRLADRLYDPLFAVLEGPLAWLNGLPCLVAAMLAGDYGVVAMFPFLLLYALPTIVMFAGLLAIYKSTGLIDRLSYGLHPWLRPFGMDGRDLVRVVMGFGCNVPAILATRCCSSCSRGACVSAISFGSACSYQLPATLAVFAATGYVWLSPIYLLVVALTTLVYLRLTVSRAQRAAKGRLRQPTLRNIQRPSLRVIGQEIRESFGDFCRMALPIFVGICLIAGVLQWSGALAVLTELAAPLMVLFRLPPEAVLAVVLGAVRKDGLAIGLLDGEWNALKVPMDAPLQVLTAVYLAGVFLPCLVTLFTVVREMRLGFALKMVSRQAGFAVLFSLLIAWGGYFILSILST